MGVKIYVHPDEVWSFFKQNKKRLENEMVIIAENTDTEYAVYLTEYHTMPQLLACKGDKAPEYKEVTNEDGCSKVTKKFYTSYLYPVMVTTDKYSILDNIDDDDDAEDMTRQDMEDAQYEREDELQLALCSFLAVVLGEEMFCDETDIMEFYGTEFVNDVLDNFLEYLATEYSLQIYRPMIVTDEETGCEIYTEYPYDADSYFEDDETVIPGGWS